jgi:hypothetical protein
MERESSQAYHPVVVLFDDADKKARVVFGEKLAIDYQNVVAVPNCGHIVPPLLSRAGGAGLDVPTIKRIAVRLVHTLLPDTFRAPAHRRSVPPHHTPRLLQTRRGG